MVWGSSSGVGLGLLVPMKRTFNAFAFPDNEDNSMLPTLWNSLGKTLFCARMEFSVPHLTLAPDLTNALLDEWAKIPHTRRSCWKPWQKNGSYYSYSREGDQLHIDAYGFRMKCHKN